MKNLISTEMTGFAQEYTEDHVDVYMHISSPSTIIDDIRFPDDDGQKYSSYVPDFKENVDRLYSDA